MVSKRKDWERRRGITVTAEEYKRELERKERGITRSGDVTSSFLRMPYSERKKLQRERSIAKCNHCSDRLDSEIAQDQENLRRGRYGRVWDSEIEFIRGVDDEDEEYERQFERDRTREELEAEIEKKNREKKYYDNMRGKIERGEVDLGSGVFSIGKGKKKYKVLRQRAIKKKISLADRVIKSIMK